MDYYCYFVKEEVWQPKLSTKWTTVHILLLYVHAFLPFYSVILSSVVYVGWLSFSNQDNSLKLRQPLFGELGLELTINIRIRWCS